MNVSGYSTSDVKLFRAVLDASMVESLACGANIPLELMTIRLFKAAERGERDPRRLVEAVLSVESPVASQTGFPSELRA